jgi:hypothetical protein
MRVVPEATAAHLATEEVSWHEIISDLSGRSDRFDANADRSGFGVELDENRALWQFRSIVCGDGSPPPPLARVGGCLHRIATEAIGRKHS